MRSFRLFLWLWVVSRTSLGFVVSPPVVLCDRKRTCPSSLCATRPTAGQIVTVDCALNPDGDFVPEPLFDTHGTLSFVLHLGNYLPGLHDLIATMTVGEKLERVSIDAGWGDRNDNRVAEISLTDLEQSMEVSQIKVGVRLQMANGMTCVVTERTDDTITIDANPALAGASYSATVELLKVEDGPTDWEYTDSPSENSKYQVATVALGCFWGGQLKFARQTGVVGTQVGYTHGNTENPTYEQVCSGGTGHTEAIQLIFDESLVSYERLIHVAMDQLGENKYLKNQVGNDIGTQYRHGIYYHSPQQKEVAQSVIDSFGQDCVTECLPATKFYKAEDYHQHYLLKGGQSTRKGEDSVIRCYG